MPPKFHAPAPRTLLGGPAAPKPPGKLPFTGSPLAANFTPTLRTEPRAQPGTGFMSQLLPFVLPSRVSPRMLAGMKEDTSDLSFLARTTGPMLDFNQLHGGLTDEQIAALALQRATSAR